MPGAVPGGHGRSAGPRAGSLAHRPPIVLVLPVRRIERMTREFISSRFRGEFRKAYLNGPLRMLAGNPAAVLLRTIPSH